ncbi:acyltransferase [Companilactobacillus ginsenosidimutans]|uniref:Acyltransferase 3 domain-containing protein n=1 Tax=Companilactobacillus ginsenosidimutans TaxID=1007676 RepID=A0A0H4QM09_9LACO|nr:acyltransferase [Companilactobacillus ginsenosidimutans]AKP67743.1 hypothetical protein ABM34_09525 [Companilactobacillus ginsenosidimutans]
MSQKRINYIDYLKIMAIFGVVLSHSLANTLAGKMFTAQWDWANFFLGIVSPSVGIFFMVSGALILTSPHTNDLHYLFTHRLVKIVVPFLIWAGITIAVFNRTIPGFSANIWFHKFLTIYNQFPSTAFWFMYPLIGFYLLSPMIKAFVDKASLRVVDYVILLWFITNILLPFIVQIMPSRYAIYLSYQPKFSLILLGQTFGYFLIGYRLHKTPIKRPKVKWNFILTITLLALTIGLNYLNAKKITNIPVIGYESPIAVIFTAEIFWTIKKWSVRNPLVDKFKNITPLFSSLAYGIYLSHGVIMSILETVLNVHNFVIVFVLTSIICLLLTYLVSRIPKVRYTLFGI